VFNLIFVERRIQLLILSCRDPGYLCGFLWHRYLWKMER